MNDQPNREMSVLARIERLPRAQRREQRNAEIMEYVKLHGDHRSTFETLGERYGLTAMTACEIWRTAFSRWNYRRQLQGQWVIANYGASTQRARYLLAPAATRHMPQERVKDLYSKEPRYTIEEAFVEIARLDAESQS